MASVLVLADTHETRPTTVAGRAPAVTYTAIGGVLLVLLAVTGSYGQWLSDSWIHAGTLVEVARHPLHPAEPLTGEHVGFPYFSPWAMALGWLMRLTGWSAWVVLTGAGLVGTGLLLASWYRLVRALTAARWAPVVALVLMLLLWGTGTWFWSGFPSLATLSVGFVWPSVLALACWFETWRTALRIEQVGTAHRILAFGVLPGLMLLIHPFTAAIATVSVLLTLATRVRRAAVPVATAVLAAAASGVLALAWPWTGLATMTGDRAGFDAIHHALYHDLAVKYGLLPLIVPALLLRLRADRRDPLFWTAVLCGAGCAVGALTGFWSLARLGPGVLLPGQAALAVLLAEGWSRRVRWGRRPRAGFAVLAGLTCLAVVIGGYANAWAVARALPGTRFRAAAERATHAPVPYPQLGWIAGHVRPGDTAIANFWHARRELATYGLRTVQPQWPSPGVPDAARRTADQAGILNPRYGDAARRARLLARYRVRWIVWQSSARYPVWPYPGARLVACGPHRTALLRVDPAAGPPRACR